jgi:hypothetical protein
MNNSGRNQAPDAPPLSAGAIAAAQDQEPKVQPPWAEFQVLAQRLEQAYAETLGAPLAPPVGDPGPAGS